MGQQTSRGPVPRNTRWTGFAGQEASSAPRPTSAAEISQDVRAAHQGGKLAVTATAPVRRSDEPNQINNVLCFPGLFRGLLDAGATRVTTTTKLAAARAIAGLVADDELSPDSIIPSPFDARVVPAVAAAVADVARREGAVAAR